MTAAATAHTQWIGPLLNYKTEVMNVREKNGKQAHQHAFVQKYSNEEHTNNEEYRNEEENVRELSTRGALPVVCDKRLEDVQSTVDPILSTSLTKANSKIGIR